MDICKLIVNSYVGDLIIDEDGNWYGITHKGKKGMQNPVFRLKDI